ncbi:hypothetical protein PSHT_15466 [Puccinia striiformis]|uniref:Uncharacterized protein n=1 Tax=Puccinia striiformis TaxID=27350 RepID=A0A2S4UES6_9BASI|nr:hypothetical protein PSHT_15466 [Puccinia striiformis]
MAVDFMPTNKLIISTIASFHRSSRRWIVLSGSILARRRFRALVILRIKSFKDYCCGTGPSDCRFRIQSSFQNLLPLDLLLPALAILSRSINFLIFNLIDLSSHSFLWRTVAEKVVESTPSFHLSHQSFGSAAGIERYCRSNSTPSLLYYRHFTVLDIGNHRSPLQEPADKVVESIRSFHSSHQLPGSAVGIKRYLTSKGLREEDSRTDSWLSNEPSIAPIASVNLNLSHFEDQNHRFRIKIDFSLPFSFLSVTSGAQRYQNSFLERAGHGKRRRASWDATGASEDDMAQQLGFFVLRDDLLNIVETLDGYEPPDWPRLKASMTAYWGRDEIPRFTLEDFEQLLVSWSEKDAISPTQDYPVFCNSLQPIVSQFLGNNDMDTEEAQDIFYQAFSRVLQLSLHRSTSVSNETPIHPVIDYQAPTKNSPLLESPPTVFSDIIATPSVPESQEEEVNAEPEPSEQLIEDPKEAAVSLLPPMPSARGSLDHSEVCLENSVENDHLNASDSGLYDFRYLQLPDISAFELLKMEPLVKEEKTTLVSLHQVKKNWEDSTVSFGHLVNAVEHNPIPSAPTMLQIDSLPEGLGEDHNYFIDRFHPSDHIFIPNLQFST